MMRAVGLWLAILALGACSTAGGGSVPANFTGAYGGISGGGFVEPGR